MDSINNKAPATPGNSGKGRMQVLERRLEDVGVGKLLPERARLLKTVSIWRRVKRVRIKVGVGGGM